MATGTVKWFNSVKGYGFISPDGGNVDVFVHISAIEKAGLPSLTNGQRIEFEVIKENGKQYASNLKLL